MEDSQTAYIGVTCADATLGMVYEMNVATGATTPTLTIPATYFSTNRGSNIGGGGPAGNNGIFLPWADTWADLSPAEAPASTRRRLSPTSKSGPTVRLTSA